MYFMLSAFPKTVINKQTLRAALNWIVNTTTAACLRDDQRSVGIRDGTILDIDYWTYYTIIIFINFFIGSSFDFFVILCCYDFLNALDPVMANDRRLNTFMWYLHFLILSIFIQGVAISLWFSIVPIHYFFTIDYLNVCSCKAKFFGRLRFGFRIHRKDNLIKDLLKRMIM